MIKKFLSTLSLFLLIATVTSVAQVKIGYMDVQNVLSELPEMKNIESELGNFVTQKQQQLQDRTASFQEAVADYQQNQASMSQAQQQSREEELAEMENELRNFQQSLQVEIQQYRNKLLEPVYADIDEAIASIAENMNLDFVLNKATTNGENIVHYSSQENLNITDRVIERIKNQSNQN